VEDGSEENEVINERRCGLRRVEEDDQAFHIPIIRGTT
jgi:hypothetical protein